MIKNAPLGTSESILFVVGIVLGGFLLQWVVGYFDFGLLHTPGNFIALGILAALIGAGVYFQDSPFVRWFAGIPMAIALIAALLVFGLFMDLTPQVSRLAPNTNDAVSRLGFRMVTSSWPFVLLYGTTLIALGITSFKRLVRFSRRDIAFLCNHLGLWVLMVSAGLGAADMFRVVMNVERGQTERTVYSADGKSLQLPISVTLKDFVMEEYPPSLTILDHQRGVSQSKEAAEYFQIDTQRTAGRLGDWLITVEEYVHDAVRIGDSYRAYPMPVATPAAKVAARHLRTHETRTGWVCSGGSMPDFISVLVLDERHTLVMTVPEPKRYASSVTILAEGGEPIDAILEVNQPVKVGDWRVYQYGYDTAAGKQSRYSAIELVFDPWLLPAQIGMGIMAAGAILLVWNGAGKRRESK
ncbi:MAG: cytochrome c biogenesis protein ResB [Azoarcus sp.]|jgi:hypothetical protein|nr:cytochrome c biogenesis protein ResB [Azoarcus sp.]